MNHYFVRQTNGKRFLAGFLDFVIVVVLAIFLYVPAQMIGEQAGYANTLTEIGLIAVYSGLFEVNHETGGIKQVTEEEQRPKALYTFYVDKINTNTGALQRGYSPILRSGSEFNSADDYYDSILLRGNDETLFDFTTIDSEKPWDIPVIAGKEAAAKTFYENEILKAETLLDSHERVVFLIRKAERMLFYMIAGSYLLAAILLIILLPLVLPNSVTLGKLITKSVVVNDLGFKTTFLQVNMRNLAIFFFSFIFFFVPFLLVSIFMMFLSKEGKSLFDRLSATRVADKNASLLFKDINEETAYRKNLAKSLIQIDRQKEASRAEEEKARKIINSSN